MRTENKWKNFYLTIGKSIKAEREHTGKTLKEVAEAIGLSNEAVLHRYERGERRPLPHVLLALGRFLKSDDLYFLRHADMPVESRRDEYQRNFHTQIQKMLEAPTDDKELLKSLLPLMAHLLNVGVISVFAYQWLRSALCKFSEHISELVKIPVNNVEMPKKLPAEDVYFYESYNVWQKRYVTELAWENEDDEYRFITNYKRIHSSYPRRVNMYSYKWHENISGTVLSTMYGVIGSPERKYLIRCFNRSDHVGGLLDLNQYHALRHICRVVSERLETSALEASFGRIRDLGLHMQYGESLASNMQRIGDKLREEGAASGIFLWNTKPGEDFHYTYTFGEHFTPWQTNHSIHTNARGFINADLRARIFGNESYFTVDVFEEIRHGAAHTMEAFISAWNERQRSRMSGAEVGCLLVFPLQRDEQKRGALIIPIEVGPSFPSPPEGASPGATHPAKMDIVSAIPSTIQTLNTYASIAYSVIAGSRQGKQERS
jgi:transcriptional regulator with XRE-family HTH domain